MDAINYTTKSGDRIDALAYRFYGSPQGIQVIADANPDVPVTAVYPLGTILIMPILDDAQLTNKDDLPPWKR
ncbi:MAG: tail protein X [Dysgonamonadaceae bacterium]|jgi:phage tail protein X|nr:tail protein X [Dysgonamonadaceae bacterium]